MNNEIERSADDLDVAAQRSQADVDQRVAAARRQAQIDEETARATANGSCLFCSAEIEEPGRRFCDKSCAAGWENMKRKGYHG